MEKKILKMLFLGCMLLNVSAASAAELDDRWYVAPWVGYVRADADQIVENTIAYGISVGKPVNENWNLELAVSAFQLDPENSDEEFEQTSLGADALYFFSRNPTFATFAVLGAGMQHTEFGDVDGDSFMYNVGLGGQSTLGKGGTALRFELRYRRDNNDTRIQDDSEFEDWMLMVGLAIPLGERPAPAAAAKP